MTSPYREDPEIIPIPPCDIPRKVGTGTSGTRGCQLPGWWMRITQEILPGDVWKCGECGRSWVWDVNPPGIPDRWRQIEIRLIPSAGNQTE